MIKGKPAPKMKTQGHNALLIHLAEFPIDEVLAIRTDIRDKTKVSFEVPDGKVFKVKTNSLRYHVFAQSSVCECCGLEGSRMLLDIEHKQQKDGHSPHFNLYGEYEGELILMTKDHKIPRSRGGTDNLDNFQTLCTRCNCVKGNRFLSINELREEEIVKEYMK